MEINRLIHTDLEPENMGVEVGLKYLQAIYSTVHRHDFSFISLTVGRHRTGKSLWELTKNWLLDVTFRKDLENRVCYSPQGFMEALDHIQRERIKGGCIMWDEAGYGLPSRDWYDISNKSINYALQVFGYLNPIIGFVTPDISFIDSQAKKLLQTLYVASRPSSDYAYIKPYNVLFDRRYGKTYYPHPRLIIKKRHFQLKRIMVPKPPDKLIKRYIKHSIPWKDTVVEQMKARTKKLDIDGLSYAMATPEKLAEALKTNWENFQTTRSRLDLPQLDIDLICTEFKVPTRMGKKIKRDVEKELLEEVNQNAGK